MKTYTNKAECFITGRMGLLLILAVSLMLNGCTVSIPNPNKVYPLEEKVLSGEGADKILIIEIAGIITENDSSKGFGGHVVNIVARVKEVLDRAETDNSIRAILLRINSPGGEVTATDIIYNQLLEFKKRKNIPIIADITAVGASGAYYIAMAADKVIARPTSVTGSIGVIIQGVNAVELLKKMGLKSVTYKSGKFKDMGSPLKPLSDEETQIVDEIIKQMHNRFLGIVSKGRNLDMNIVNKIGDGRVYTASQAKENQLIDEIGYFKDAVQLTKKLAGLELAQVVIYHRENEYKNNIYNKSGAESSLQLLGVNLDNFLSNNYATFLYQWQP